MSLDDQLSLSKSTTNFGNLSNQNDDNDENNGTKGDDSEGEIPLDSIMSTAEDTSIQLFNQLPEKIKILFDNELKAHILTIIGNHPLSVGLKLELLHNTSKEIFNETYIIAKSIFTAYLHHHSIELLIENEYNENDFFFVDNNNNQMDFNKLIEKEIVKKIIEAIEHVFKSTAGNIIYFSSFN